MVGKFSDCNLSDNEVLFEEELESVNTGGCFGLPTSVLVVGLYLNGMRDSGSDAWQASSIMTASNSESFL